MPSFIDFLGGQLLVDTVIENSYDLILLSKSGITKASVESVISHAGMSKKTFVEEILNISMQTQKRKADNDKFDKRTSSLVIEIARVLEHTYRVFGTMEKAQRWLAKPSGS